jgi:Ca2+-binding RTX toxin-like protein
MRNRTRNIIAAACQMEALEARALYSTSVNLDTSAVQQILNGAPAFQPAMSYNGAHGVLVTANPGSGTALGSVITATLLDSTGAPTGTTFQVNSGLLSLDDHPAVATASDGSFVVTWTSVNSVYCQTFSAAGTATDTATKVSSSLVADNSAVAYTTGGGFVVTYQALSGLKTNIYAQLYNADGSANGAAFMVNASSAMSTQKPRVSSDANGNFTVVWQQTTTLANLDDIYFQQYTAAGLPIGMQTIVNTTTAGEQADPDISEEPSGAFIVAWDSTNSGLTMVDFQQFDSTATPVGMQTLASSEDTALQTNPAVVIRNDGIFGIAWVDTALTTISTKASYYTATGSPITTAILSDNGEAGDRPAIQFVPSGTTAVAYGTSIDSTVSTDVETLSPDLSVDGTGLNNVITGLFNGLTFNVTVDGTQSIFPSAILQSIEVDGGSGNDTINITGTSSSWTGGLTVNGDDGNDSITIGDLRTTVLGGDGNDTITIGAGDDSIVGGAGNDSITGGAGSSVITDGDGNDTIVSGTGASILDAGNGNDLIEANDLGETISVGNGKSIIDGGTGNDTITAGSGADTIYGSGGNDSVNSTTGNDLVYLGLGGASTVMGSTGSDTVSYALDTAPVFAKLGGFSGNGPAGENDFLGSVVHNLIGGAGNDTLIAGPGIDALYGGSGNDLLEAAGGTDRLDGNDGNDTLLAGSGTDNFIGASGINTLSFADMPGRITASIDGLPDSGWNGQKDIVSLTIQNIIAGSGSDVITGSNANNVITGGSGSDTLLGMGGDDTIFAGSGNDYIDGGSGNDWIKGGAGTDELDGGTGDDMIYSGTGNDTLHGNTGNDTLFGGTGIDYLYGDAGNDTLYTGKGHAILNGGSGSNMAVAKKGDIISLIQKLKY